MIGIIGGAFFSWLITHFYYRRGNKEQKEELNKFKNVLSEEIQEVILTSTENNLSIQELNDLINDKAIDQDALGVDPLPYKACPKCGNQNLDGGSHYMKDDIYYYRKCSECNWFDFTQ